MSTFTQLNDWVNTNIKPVTKVEEVSTAKLEELISLAQSESDSIKNLIDNSLLEFTGDDAMLYLSRARVKGHNPNATDYMQNAFGGVVVKRDVSSTDGIITVALVVPDFYSFRLVMRADSDKKLKTASIQLKTVFESVFVPKKLYIGNIYGEVKKEIFEFKDKVDSHQKLEEELIPAKPGKFGITIPPERQPGDIVYV